MRKLAYHSLIVALVGLAFFLLDKGITSAKVSYQMNKATSHTDKLLSPIIKIRPADSNFGGCTAFVVSDNLAMTSSHCIKTTGEDIAYAQETARKQIKLMKKQIRSMQGNPFAVMGIMQMQAQIKAVIDYVESLEPDVFRVFSENSPSLGLATGHSRVSVADVAFITGDFKNFKKLKVRTGFANSGFLDTYFSCGYPANSKYILCQKVGFRFYSSFNIAANGQLMPGFSGSPLINEDGEVIGVASAMTVFGVAFYASTLGAF